MQKHIQQNSNRCRAYYPHEEHDLPLCSIRGRPCGKAENNEMPQWVGILRENGKIRIDCENYPESWIEIDLPEEVLRAWRQIRQGSNDVGALLATATQGRPQYNTQIGITTDTDETDTQHSVRQQPRTLDYMSTTEN